MLEFAGRKIPNELSEIVAPECTVLLVWDMQNDQAGGSFNIRMRWISLGGIRSPRSNTP
jgi:hypothetical protein